MRVKEILHEQRVLQEQLFRLGVALKYVLSQGGEGVTGQARSVLNWFSRAVMGKANAAEELAQGWVKTAEILKITPSEAIQAGKAEALSVGIDRAVVREAEQLAARLATQSSILASRASRAAMEWYYGSALHLYNTILTTIGVVQPILECVYYIYQAYRKNEAGDPEFQGDKLDYAVQFEITKAVRSVAGLLAGRGLISWIMGPKGIQVLAPFGWEPIAKAFNMASPAAQAAFITWFQTSAGQEYFAQWLVGKALIPGTDWTLPGGTLFKIITRYAGGWAKTGYDAILRQIGSDKAAPAPREPAPDNWKSSIRKDPTTGQYTTDKPSN